MSGAARTTAALLLTIVALMVTGGVTRTAEAEAQDGCLLVIHINPESRVGTERGTAPARLRQGVWQSFSVRFDNEAKITAVPHIISPNSPAGRDRSHWLEMRLEPSGKRLSGHPREYRTLRLRSRDSGPRDATFRFDVGQGTQDLGFRGDASLLFQCSPAPSKN